MEQKYTAWDTHPKIQISSALLAPNFPEHYAKLKKYFSNNDVILDVGCGNDKFSEYIPNATGVDHNIDLTTYDLSSYNTLYFSEIIGYLSQEILEKLVSTNNIKKIVIKDFLTSNNPEGVEEYFSYDFTTLNNFMLPLLEQNGYTIKVEEFFPYTHNFVNTMRDIGLTYMDEGKLFFVKSWFPLELTMKPVIVTATRP